MSRCNSLTHEGVQCRRKTFLGGRYCWQHESAKAKFGKTLSLGTVLLAFLSFAADSLGIVDFFRYPDRTVATPVPPRASAALTPTPSRFGPVEGELFHDTRNAVPEAFETLLMARDFVAEAIFSNPYDTGEGQWSYGFIFRQTPTTQYQLVLDSSRTWALRLARPEDPSNPLLIDSGEVDYLETNYWSFNYVRLIVLDTRGDLFVNSNHVAGFDLAANLASGTIAVATGFNPYAELPGESTAFSGFTVWPIAGPVFGPRSGQLGTRGDSLEYLFTSLSLRNFVAEVELVNTAYWSQLDRSAGFAFRSTGPDDNFNLLLSPTGGWTLTLISSTGGALHIAPVGAGPLTGLDLTANAANHLRLVALDDTGYLFVNRSYKATTVISHKLLAGDIGLVSLAVPEHLSAPPTSYSGFCIWTIP